MTAEAELPYTPLVCDYLLLVATSTEKEQLFEVADTLGIKIVSKKGMYGNYYDLGQIGLSKVFAIRTSMGPLSYGGSASKAILCQIETQAKGLISLGMAFGIDPQTQNVGDILVSTAIIPYDNRDVRTENEQTIFDYSRANPHPSKQSLLRIFQRAASKVEWQGKVHFGNMLSGAARIFCARYRNQLVEKCQSGIEPIVGGEMEGVGLLSVSPSTNPLWVIVKAVSDFADGNRDHIIESTRRVACEKSAIFVLSALKELTEDALDNIAKGV